MSGTVTVRVLEDAPAALSAVQRVLEASPRYFISVTGQVAPSTSAETMSLSLPAGKQIDDKYLCGIFANEDMLGAST
jgi:hypothetical protein